MNEGIKRISKIEIKKLWGKFDIVWELKADVNILSGINGSGKTTILNCIYWLIAYAELPDELKRNVDEVKVYFNEKQFVTYEHKIEKISELEERSKNNVLS